MQKKREKIKKLQNERRNLQEPHITGTEFTGIRIHGGNTAADTFGCLLVGKNTVVGRLTESLATFKPLYAKLYEHCVKNGGKCYITFK